MDDLFKENARLSNIVEELRNENARLRQALRARNHNAQATNSNPAAICALVMSVTNSRKPLRARGFVHTKYSYSSLVTPDWLRK